MTIDEVREQISKKIRHSKGSAIFEVRLSDKQMEDVINQAIAVHRYKERRGLDHGQHQRHEKGLEILYKACGFGAEEAFSMITGLSRDRTVGVNGAPADFHLLGYSWNVKWSQSPTLKLTLDEHEKGLTCCFYAFFTGRPPVYLYQGCIPREDLMDQHNFGTEPVKEIHKWTLASGRLLKERPYEATSRIHLGMDASPGPLFDI